LTKDLLIMLESLMGAIHLFTRGGGGNVYGLGLTIGGRTVAVMYLS